MHKKLELSLQNSSKNILNKRKQITEHLKYTKKNRTYNSTTQIESLLSFIYSFFTFIF